MTDVYTCTQAFTWVEYELGKKITKSPWCNTFPCLLWVGWGKEGDGGGRPIMDFSPWTLFRPPGDVKSATSPTIHFNSNSWQGCTSCVVQQGANITFQHILTSFCIYRSCDQLICNEGCRWRYLPSDFLPKFIIKFCLRVWVWILTVLYVIQAILYFIGAISASVNIDEVKNLWS